MAAGARVVGPFPAPATGGQSPAAAVSLRDVTVVYSGGIRGLDGVALEIPAGCLVGVAGANGAGKSTLARLLDGLVRPTSGRVLIEGRDTAGVPVRRLVKTHRDALMAVVRPGRALRLPEHALPRGVFDPHARQASPWGFIAKS